MSKKLTLKKGAHKVTTSSRTEQVQLLAEGYQVEVKKAEAPKPVETPKPSERKAPNTNEEN